MNLWIVALIAFLIGLIIGAGVLYLIWPARRKSSDLSRERDDVRSQLDQYQEQVDKHFLETADLVNEMTSAYRAVHQRLSHGAHELCSEEGQRQASERNLAVGSDEKLLGTGSDAADGDASAQDASTSAEDAAQQEAAQADAAEAADTTSDEAGSDAKAEADAKADTDPATRGPAASEVDENADDKPAAPGKLGEASA